MHRRHRILTAAAFAAVVLLSPGFGAEPSGTLRSALSRDTQITG